MARLMDEGDEEAGREAPMVIVYDAAGQRSASVASRLSQALNGKVVYNLAGGVVSCDGNEIPVVANTCIWCLLCYPPGK